MQDSSADKAGLEVDNRAGKGKHERMFKPEESSIAD